MEAIYTDKKIDLTKEEEEEKLAEEAAARLGIKFDD